MPAGSYAQDKLQISCVFIAGPHTTTNNQRSTCTQSTHDFEEGKPPHIYPRTASRALRTKIHKYSTSIPAQRGTDSPFAARRTMKVYCKKGTKKQVNTTILAAVTSSAVECPQQPQHFFKRHKPSKLHAHVPHQQPNTSQCYNDTMALPLPILSDRDTRMCVYNKTQEK